MAVVGGPGSEKSTLASVLAGLMNTTHVELDRLWWRPGWLPLDLSSFRKAVAELANGDAWVIDGNYLEEVGRDVVWSRADTLVWLDPPRSIAVVRTLRRSVGRVVARTALWGTNRQGVSTLTPTSIARLIRRWPEYSVRVESLLREGVHPQLTVVRLRSDSEARRWLASIQQQPECRGH